MNDASIVTRSTGSPMCSGSRNRAFNSIGAHSRVVADLPVELLDIDVERVHALRAVQQQKVSESAGGGTDIETDLAANLDSESLERRPQASRRRG